MHTLNVKRIEKYY